MVKYDLCTETKVHFWLLGFTTNTIVNNHKGRSSRAIFLHTASWLGFINSVSPSVISQNSTMASASSINTKSVLGDRCAVIGDSRCVSINKN